MKRISIISGLALLMLASGCQKEMVSVSSAPAQNSIVFGVTIDEPSKTVLSDNLSVLWKAGDKVRITDGSGVSEIISVDAAYDGKASAQFTTTTLGAGPYTFFYPAEAVNLENNAITFPSTQVVGQGTFDGKIAVLAGVSETSSVVMSSLNAFIKVNLSEAVDGIIVESLDNRPIAGSFEATVKSSVDPEGGHTYSMSIVAVSGTGAVSVKDAAPAKSFIVSIPEGRYGNGFAVKFQKGGKLYSAKVGTAGIVLNAGKIVNMPELDCSLAKEEAVAKVILTADDFVNFLSTEAAGFTAEQKAVIAADIDLSGKTVTTATKFDGILDGQGFSIKNLSATNALIDVNNGTLMNLFIDESSSAVFSGDGKDISGIICNDNKGVVECCINNADVSINDKLTATGARGGMIGQSSGVVKSCVNNGNFTVNVESIVKPQYYGCVVGQVNIAAVEGTTALVSNCSNNGNLFINCATKPGNAYVGGVAGGNTASKIANAKNIGIIENCTNKGNVTYGFQALDSGTYSIVGGVVGNWEGNVNYCINTGNVNYLLPYESDEFASTCPAIGGVAGIAVYNLTGCINIGDVRLEGVWAAGTAGNAGAGGTSAPCFGGVVGKHGTSSSAQDANVTISACGNMGDISGIVKMRTGGGTSDYFGGIAGMSNGNILGCTNEGEIDLVCGSKTAYVAGIVGGGYGYKIERCTNNADVTIEGTSAVSAALDEAGIVAYAYFRGMTIDQCTNNGVITMKNNANTTTTAYHYLAGIMANYNGNSQIITNCVNQGDIVSTCKKKMRIAGIVAAIYDDTQVAPTIDPETGEVTDDGTPGKNPLLNCVNSGNIYVTDAIANAGPDNPGTIVGGMTAYGSIGYTGCSNTGNIVLNNCAPNTASGLFVGTANRRYDVVNCTLDGSITSDVPANKLGFFVGMPYNSDLNTRYFVGPDSETAVNIVSTANINGVTPTRENLPDMICGGDFDPDKPLKKKQILLKHAKLLIPGGDDTK